MQYIDLTDFLLLPLYLFIFYVVVRKKALQYTEIDLRNIFFTAFFLRMFGSFAYAMMIQYYYGYGDSFGFYWTSNFFTEHLNKDIGNISYFFAPAEEVGKWVTFETGDNYYSGYTSNPANIFVAKLAAVISYFSFNRYLIISLFFGFFSFAGQWKLFQVFNDINKGNGHKLLAFAVLYTPSIWFWGSGLIKDSICLGATGFIFSILYNGMVKRKMNIFGIFYCLILGYTLYQIKSYIIIILFVCLSIIFIYRLFAFIKNTLLRSLIILSFILAISVFAYVTSVSSELQSLAMDAKAQVDDFQHNYSVSQEFEENSKGFIGLREINGSVGGIILQSPIAIFTCLFRPFIWESRSIAFLFTSLESMLLLFCTIYLLYKTRIRGFFRIIFRNEYLLFSFILSLLFAMVIGFTTFNFGTMSRYRIILLPFYYFMLVGVYLKYQEHNRTDLQKASHH